MAKNNFKAPDFDDIVFEFRNKEYGAYRLRKKYNRNIMIAVFMGAVFAATAIITPYIIAKGIDREEREYEINEVTVTMDDLIAPDDVDVPPPPPPPPPVDVDVRQAYVPPVVVEEVDEDQAVAFMTAEEVRETVVDAAVNEVIEVAATTEGREEIRDDREEIPEFVVVEEMPMYPGGDAALIAYIMNSVVYPERAKENNIQGRVYLQFVVTSRGNIGEVRIMRGSGDAELDAEAVRVIRTIEGFRPGRQGGVAVPVWYSVPVSYQLR